MRAAQWVNCMKLVALGSNLSSVFGEPATTLRSAAAALAREKIILLKLSPLYRTPAWPNPDDPPFVNAVTSVETDLQPHELLRALHSIESAFGRTRSYSNAPRTLDLDLLDYDGRIETGWPLLPHPRLQTRAFVLVPLQAVAPDWRHPVSGLSVEALLAHLPAGERDSVIRLDSSV